MKEGGKGRKERRKEGTGRLPMAVEEDGGTDKNMGK
jgi:hypothetical protein